MFFWRIAEICLLIAVSTASNSTTLSRTGIGIGDYKSYTKSLFRSAQNFTLLPAPVPCTDLDADKEALIDLGNKTFVALCDLCPRLPFMSKLVNTMLDIPPFFVKQSLEMDECLAECFIEPMCVALSFDHLEKVCYLINSTSGGDFISVSQYTTVLTVQPVNIVGSFLYYRHTNLFGHELDFKIGESLVGCIGLCQSFNQQSNISLECTGARYQFGSENCTLLGNEGAKFSVELDYGSVAILRADILYNQDTQSQSWRFTTRDTEADENHPNSGKPKNTEIVRNKLCGESDPSQATGTIYNKACLTSNAIGCDVKTGCQQCSFPENNDDNSTKVQNLPVCPNSLFGAKGREIERNLDILEKCFVDCVQQKNGPCSAVDEVKEGGYCKPIPHLWIQKRNFDDVRHILVVAGYGTNTSIFNLVEKMSLRREDEMTSSVTVESPESCEQHCQQMERCVKMTYHHDSKLCIIGSQAAILYDNTNNTDKENGDGDKSSPPGIIAAVSLIKRPTIASPFFAFRRQFGVKVAKDFLVSHHACDCKNRDCENSECDETIAQCLKDCGEKVENCTAVSIRFFGKEKSINCSFVSAGQDPDIITDENSELFVRVFDHNITLEKLDVLHLIDSSSAAQCFSVDDNRLTESQLYEENEQPNSIDSDDKNSTSISTILIRRKRNIFGDFFDNVLKPIGEAVVGVVKDVVDTVVNVGEATVKVFQGDLEGAGKKIIEAPLVKDVIDSGKNIVAGVGKVVEGDLSGLGDIALGALDFIPGPGNVVGKIGGKIGKKIGKTAKDAKDNVKDAQKKLSQSDKDKRPRREERDSRNGDEKRKKDDDDDDKDVDENGDRCKRATAPNRRPAPGAANNGRCNKKRKSDKDVCNPPKLLKNVDEKTLASCRDKAVGRQCRHECDPGYRVEPDTSQCRKLGTVHEWTPKIECVLQSCGTGLTPNYPLIPHQSRMPSGTPTTVFVSLFDKQRKLPVWSVQYFDMLNRVPVNKRLDRFKPHPCTELSGHQATKAQYKGSGWHRGHLTPALTSRFSKKSVLSSTLFTNVAPQDGYTNSGPWAQLEGHTTCFLKRQSGALVATGVCSGTIAKIKGSLDIPTCFWKMLCYKDENGDTQVVGFIGDNNRVSDTKSKEKRSAQIRTPVSQAEIKIKMGAQYALYDPWVPALKYVFEGRLATSAVSSAISGQKGPPTPTSCSLALQLPKIEKDAWEKSLGAQKVGKRRKRENEIVRGCTPNEAKAMALLLGIPSLDMSRVAEVDDADEPDDDDNDDQDDNDSSNSDDDFQGDNSDIPATKCGKRVIGYFTSWGKREFTHSQARLLTHVVFAFFEMKEDGSLRLGTVEPGTSPEESGALAASRLKNLMDIAGRYTHIRVQFALGGWENSKYFSAVAASPDRRLSFIASILQTIDEYGFDGVDIDWEYPVTGGAHEGVAADKSNYVLLMKELRTAFDEHQKDIGRTNRFLITFAGAAGQWTLDPGYDLTGLLEYADWANVMTYDFFGAWESKWGAYTGPPAPLFFGMPPRFSGKTNVDWTIKYYTCRSQMPSKITMGVPFYGRFWENVGDAADASDPMWRIAQSVNGKFVGGYVPWREIGSKWSIGSTTFHEKSKTPYIWDAGRKMFLGYENKESLQHKTNYAKEKNVGGLMIWAIDLDDDEDTLLKTVAGAELCQGDKKEEVKYRCSPITTPRWWTAEDSEEKAGMCGRSAPLFKGFYPVCDPDDPGYSCCGKFGFCGTGSDYCNCPECTDYATDPLRIVEEPIRPSVPQQWYTNDAPDGKRGRCGRTIEPFQSKTPICNPDDKSAHCCSNGGYCGNTPEFCTCEGCVDFKKTPNYVYPPIRWWTLANGPENAGKCGPSAPRLKSGEVPICEPESQRFYCCSKSGYCGSSPEFCTCDGCVDFKKNPDFKY